MNGLYADKKFTDPEKQLDCAHVFDGATVFQTESGKMIYWYTFREWASFTSMARDPLIMQHQEDIGDPVNQAAASCSKCGQPFYLP